MGFAAAGGVRSRAAGRKDTRQNGSGDIGVGCSGRWWSSRPWGCLRKDWTWHAVVDKVVIGHRLDWMSSEAFSSLTDSVIACAARRQRAVLGEEQNQLSIPRGAAGPEPAPKTRARLGTNQHWGPAGS